MKIELFKELYLCVFGSRRVSRLDIAVTSMDRVVGSWAVSSSRFLGGGACLTRLQLDRPRFSIECTDVLY